MVMKSGEGACFSAGDSLAIRGLAKNPKPAARESSEAKTLLEGKEETPQQFGFDEP